MLSVEENERLTRVGSGTEAGRLFRRYWLPVAAGADLPVGLQATCRVRVLGEDLVLYRRSGGGLALVGERCPHRGASLANGIVEREGLRCSYHGWLFDEHGACLEQPHEPSTSTFRRRVCTPAYAAAELGGLIFAYLGPAPAPELPRFDLFSGRARRRVVRRVTVPCNWLQIMENALDPAHLEWLHGHFSNHLAARAGAPPVYVVEKQARFGFERFELGVVKRRLLENQSPEEEDWSKGQQVLFPNILRLCNAVPGFEDEELQYRVPVDDTHTLHLVCRGYFNGPDDQETEVSDVTVVDEHGAFRADTIDGQDAMAWASQGPIADRTCEHLGTADAGIILYRKMLVEQLDRVANGLDPIGVFRDVDAARRVPLVTRTTSRPVLRSLTEPRPFDGFGRANTQSPKR